MAQVKKAEMRDAIEAAAFDLFCRKGYTATTMTEIAKASGMTVANLYVYFDSKLLIYYEIYSPWLLRQLTTLREAVRKFPTPRTRLKRIIIGLWGDIPTADQSFGNGMIEALASAPRDLHKPNDLLRRCETFLSEMIAESLSGEHARIATDTLLSHVLWMAYDGFTINSRIGDTRDLDAIATLLTDLILGPENVKTSKPTKAATARAPRQRDAAQQRKTSA
ncbi:TetR family transcriptional regulator [Pandoraea vervacti]|uniref:TetR family transcriptional regulator n=2 Tax=Pandoraea TaxID=93217 RepID=A0A5E5A8E9_9BURK|nr:MULTISPECIES: TetR/AcrR family transcriptional regulator [Pandoraea]AJP56829.1 TetR family transcriptional regulator [Pandoraea vervacti]VVE69971.1 TetR family transcriptional regulator [Pandoraea captiosa]